MKKILLPLTMLMIVLILSGCGVIEALIENDNQNIPEVVMTPEEIEGPEEPDETERDDTLPDPTPTEVEAVEGACYHPFLPIRDDATWEYEVDNASDYILRIEETRDDTFTMIQEIEEENISLTVDWYCTEDGLMRGSFGNLELLGEATDEDTPETDFAVIDWEGETLPAFELMEIDYNWTSSYTMDADMEVEGFTTTVQMLITLNHEVTSIEIVDVEAGTFDESFRVDTDGEMEMRMLMNDTTTTISELNFTSSTWYVEGVGMVRREDRSTGFTTITELVDSSLLD